MQSEQEKNAPESLWENNVQLPELKTALLKLSESAQQAIFYRFWELDSIDDIAKKLRLSWDEADFLITESIKTLRTQIPKNCQIKFARPAA